MEVSRKLSVPCPSATTGGLAARGPTATRVMAVSISGALISFEARMSSIPCRAAGEAQTIPTMSMSTHPVALSRLDQVGIWSV